MLVFLALLPLATAFWAAHRRDRLDNLDPGRLYNAAWDRHLCVDAVDYGDCAAGS